MVWDYMKKKYMMIGIITIAVIIIIPVSLKMMMKKETGKKISILDHKKVEGLYVKNADSVCTDIPTDDNINLFLIFGQMKKDKVLSDSIDVSTYKSEANKIVKNVSENVNYTYEGYKYTMSGDKIVRVKTECTNSYVSKLYGYSQGEDKLYLTITSGYVNGDKVYNLSGEEIGEYSKDKLNSILDDGTMKNYIFDKEGSLYKFEKVED